MNTLDTELEKKSRPRISIDCSPMINLKLAQIASTLSLELGRKVTMTEVIIDALRHAYPELKDIER